jgi:hypothetical protein
MLAFANMLPSISARDGDGDDGMAGRDCDLLPVGGSFELTGGADGPPGFLAKMKPAEFLVALRTLAGGPDGGMDCG